MTKEELNAYLAENREQILRVRSRLATTTGGRVKQTRQNCLLALREDPLLKGALRTNDFTGDRVILKDVGWHRSGINMTDEDRIHIYLHLERYYDLQVEKNIDHAITIVCTENHYHPVIELLESLRWDGQQRLPYVLHHFLGAEVCELNHQVMKLFMLSALDRLYHPGCKVEVMLCLVGPQGAGKSSFLQRLALSDEWHCDDLKHLSDENVYQKLKGHWIMEMAEMLGTASARSVEEIKAFLSRQKETYRTPYDRYPKDRPRQCVFVGSTNTERFLPLDRSGNRRFWPVVIHPEQAEAHILADEEAGREYMRQLWAEVMEIYRAGSWPRRLEGDLEQQMELRRQDHMAEDTNTGRVQAWLDDFEGSHVCTLMIYDRCFHGPGIPDPRWKAEINSIMNHAITGWEAGPQHRFHGYGQQRSWVRQRPVNSEPRLLTACEQERFPLPPEWEQD